MRLTVFGANGPTGRLVVRQALSAGHEVVAVTRKPDEFPISAPTLRLAVADVQDPGGVGDAVDGSRAVISTFGVPYSRRKITVYSSGISNITLAMRDLGVSRLVCVSSTTVAGQAVAGETLLWRSAVIPLLRNVAGRTLYDDMERMEAIVRASGLDWTIVRPAGLFNTAEPTDDSVVAPSPIAGRNTSRADLAAALVQESTEPRYVREVVDVISRSGRPDRATFLREAFGGSS